MPIFKRSKILVHCDRGASRTTAQSKQKCNGKRIASGELLHVRVCGSTHGEGPAVKMAGLALMNRA